MKQLKTIQRLAQEDHQDNEFAFFADAERDGEISRNTYLRACVHAGATSSEALRWLREAYTRAGRGHLF